MAWREEKKEEEKRRGGGLTVFAALTLTSFYKTFASLRNSKESAVEGVRIFAHRGFVVSLLSIRLMMDIKREKKGSKPSQQNQRCSFFFFLLLPH